MVTRTSGPFEYYGQLHPGVTGESIRAAVDPVDMHVATLGTLADELRGDERRILQTTEGDISAYVATNPQIGYHATNALAAKSQFAAGCTRLFAADVDTFDSAVNEINVSYNSMISGAQHDPDVRSGDIPLDGLRAGFKAQLQPRYDTATQTLDTAADTVAAKLENGPTDEDVRQLIRQGMIPLSAAIYFPTLRLTESDKDAAYRAAVDTMIDRMRREGLLDDADPGELYRQWLENAARRGVTMETLIDIARDHDIDPDDFAVLDGAEEITDPDGKSFFLLPTDISGDDARKAVLMTYILNAGTDYGSANGGDTDYDETPYSSEEIQRIVDRQDDNSWFSYGQDVGFVHGNGGRLTTTPNGMLMGLGGNPLQDVYSMNGGTTFGDIFMLNIDDPEDAADALRETVRSGKSNYVDDDGHQYAGNLDLDRLLHHEEIHSQQWADEGYAGFIAKYLAESAVDEGPSFGLGPVKITLPDFHVEGHDNHYEEDAGLSDGGY